jgi:hypothetical protein
MPGIFVNCISVVFAARLPQSTQPSNFLPRNEYITAANMGKQQGSVYVLIWKIPNYLVSKQLRGCWEQMRVTERGILNKPEA